MEERRMMVRKGLSVVLCVVCLCGQACSDDGDAQETPSTSAVDTTVGSSGGGEDVGVDSGEDVGEDVVEGPQEETFVVLDEARITSDGSQPNFQNVSGGVDLGEGPFERVTLTVDLDTTCYPFSKWADDPPPPGHNWPALCDAFDRNFEISLHDPADSEAVPFELIRAITPFGGPMTIEHDVTDLFNALPAKERTLRAHITTWSDAEGRVSGSNGGWNVSARLVAVRGEAPRKVLAAIPLFYMSHNAETERQEYAFTLPEGTSRSVLEYRATGHGGVRDTESGACIGGAEEFCERDHKFYFNGRLRSAKTLWRDTCEEFCELTQSRLGNNTIEHCAQNPCGAIESVRAPRANWCPGDVTQPERLSFIREGGEHTFRYEIVDVFPGGSWKVSGVVYAYEE